MHFASLRTMNRAVVANLAISAVCRAMSLHVPADHPTIQACINAATSGVDECVVAPGTYHETINFLGKAITLRSSGGANVTTIDATGIGGSVVTCATDEGPDTVLDGFTITGGTGTGVAGQWKGGGMYNWHSSPTVTNCNFSANFAIDGGGMYNNGGSPAVTACTFAGNVSILGSGGGMYNYVASPTVTNCRFNRNRAGQGDGGGMSNFLSNPVVTNCTFSRNLVSYGGGGMFNFSSNPALTNCTFSDNWADSGGGMLNYGGSPTVTNCRFHGNRAVAGVGGGMYNSASNPAVTNCTFVGNTAEVFGGGMYNSGTGSLMVANSTFCANTAGFSGGGMINAYDSSPAVSNCVFWGDSPDEIAITEAAVPNVPAIHRSDVQGGLPTGAIDGGGNIDIDPMFVRPPDPGPDGLWDGVDDDYGDLRLQPGSPCINAGDPNFVPQPGETDLDGHARVLCGRVDMGAYEFGIGDYDCDQTVDLNDFTSWSFCMTAPQGGPVNPGCEPFDFNADGDVDLRDFAGFQLVMTP